LTQRLIATLAALLVLSGCGVGHELGLTGDQQNASLGQTAVAAPVFGYAVADEPQAALIAREILNDGGNAADAAAAAGFALGVTLPSRAGLGGGGVCLIAMPNQPPALLSFPAGAPASRAGQRPAAVPTMARGLLALQVKYGVLPYASVIVPAERLAGGSPVSPALETDLQVVGSALLSDPAAAAVFGPGGAILPVGATLTQPDLAATLEILRVQGIEGLTRGNFAPRFVAAADDAGGGLTMADLDQPIAPFVTPLTMTYGDSRTFVLPRHPAAGASPATASFAALDKNGGAVACATSMNNLFGTGRIAAGTGILLAAAPGIAPPPVLAAQITVDGADRVTALHTGTGDGAVSRANVISCPGGIPGAEGSCRATADPLGQGLAVGGR
jgi:gamma-glutamyltranspeptidase/glutathione hydrolase